MANDTTRALLTPLVGNNPITLQILGICSALAVTKTLATALIMSAAVTAVLVLATASVSAIRHHMPRNVRLIIQITIICSLVIVVDQVLKAFAYGLSKQLSVFVGLIVTNCIILGRAEAFASKNKVTNAFVNALGMGVGFTFALLCLGVVREILGSGTIFGVDLFGPSFQPWAVFVLPPGGFFVLAFWLFLFSVVRRRRAQAQPTEQEVRDAA